jgi:hypothetical protein
MEGETLKIYRALFSFYNSTIIPKVRWSFVHSGFVLRSENLLGPVRVDGTEVLERIKVSELPVDNTVIHPETIDFPTRSGPQTRRPAPIPGPTPFAISLAAYIEKATRIFPFCGHDEDAEVKNEEKEEVD